MSVNKEYNEYMESGVKSLVDNSTYNKATDHVTFDASKVELPKDVTPETVTTVVTWINDLTSQAEQATAQIARKQFESNDKLTTVDSTLTFDTFNIQSQHHLKQQVGEDFLYGQNTTAVAYTYTPEQASWLDTQRTADQELAQKLFG